MSALDLFASALGAFILITIVLLPFFPNLSLSGQEKAELEQAKAELAQAQAELEKEKAKQAKLAREKARLEREKAKLEQAKAKAPKTKSQLEKRVEALQQEIDDTTVLLGIKTKAKKFAFVIDMSGSIYQPRQNDYRPFITLSIQDMLAAFKSEIEVCLIGFHAPNRKTTLHYWPQSRGYFQGKQEYTRSRRRTGKTLDGIGRWRHAHTRRFAGGDCIAPRRDHPVERWCPLRGLAHGRAGCNRRKQAENTHPRRSRRPLHGGPEIY